MNSNKNKTTALHLAAKLNIPEKVRSLLLDKSVNVNAQDERGITALFQASFNGNLKL